MDELMLKDRRGLEVSTDSAIALAALDDAIDGFVTFRADASLRLSEALKADPDLVLGHVFKAGMALLSCNVKNTERAHAALTRAGSLIARANPRERGHLEAMAAWASGDLDGALRVWEALIARQPTDLLALRLAHFHYFWLGRTARMLDSVTAAKRGWQGDTAGRSWVASMEAFALEECGEYEQAEHLAREAVAYDPMDRWGVHALAHVLEMQGRAAEGIDWLDAHEACAEGANNFVFHLTWHRALFQLEKDGPDGLLDWYDRRVRDLNAPLLKALPDLYIDIQNAASLLWRLEHLGIDVGSRWGELAEKSESRIGDCTNLFTVPHFVMALAGDGRLGAAERLIAATEEFGASDQGTLGPVAGGLAVPAARAALHHRKGEWAEVARSLLPVRGELWRLGASHAQRDLLWQMLVDAVRKTGDEEMAATLMIELTASRPVPAEQRRAYARAA
jgi:tetratricopeptide (TPR) repeat protein